MANEDIPAFTAAAARSLYQTGLRDILNQAVAQTTGEISLVLQTFSKTMEKEYRNRRGRLTAMHRDIGLQAQQKVITAYGSRVNKKGTPGYRANASGRYKRYAGGKMLQALQDPNFFTASALGIGFINQSVLDRKAKQWYRLNFGAGPRGNSGAFKAKEYRLKFFQETVGSVSLKGMQPSGTYFLPKGFFVNPSGQSQGLGKSRGDIFVPIKSSSARTVQKKGGRAKKSNIWAGGPSQGFGGFHFFDPGIAHIARTWPTASLGVLNEWIDEASVAATGPVAKIAVPKSQLAKQSALIQAELARLKVTR